MDGTAMVLGAAVLLAVSGLLEGFSHRTNLARIPIRVHVNGTRGKSSVTRLIAGGMRAGGICTCAKTTGTLPRMIMPDGNEFPVFRPSRANVIEQIRIVRAAEEHRAEGLVLECMALVPLLQWLCEAKLVRATHAVITNARPDHLDVMGPTGHDVALALAGMIPHRGKLFTCEQRHLSVFERVCKDRHCELIVVGADEVASVMPLDLAGFSYIEHADNVALALGVCSDLGIDRHTALQGMQEALPDPGVMTACELDFFRRHIVFVNGFAANDPESTEQIWNMAFERYPEVSKRIIIFNCRADRPDRSIQLADACVRWRPADHYLLIGSGTYIFARRAAAKGLDERKFALAEDLRVEEIFERVIDLAGRSALVMGMANIGGPGLDLVRYFNNRSVTEAMVFGKT